MSYTLSPLPHAFDALEPYIDARTLEIHHDKHHATYLNNLNKALEACPVLDNFGDEIEQLFIRNHFYRRWKY